jgi:hypothetical protein
MLVADSRSFDMQDQSHFYRWVTEITLYEM